MRRVEIINQIASKMKEIAPWAKTILYGSEARGEAGPDSDIDLLILVPNEFKKDYNKIRMDIYDHLFELELENDIIISPLIILKEMWLSKKTPFTINVTNDGIIL